MRYDLFALQQTVLNLDGTNAQRNKAGSQNETESFNVREAFRLALNGIFFDEQPTQAKPEGSITLAEKITRYEISKKIWNADETGVELKTEEVAELKKCVGKTFISPEIYGFLEAVIEGKLPETKKTEE